MNNWERIILVLSTFCLMNCTTYRTFYKKTDSIASAQKPYNAQRLDLSTTNIDTIQKRLSDFENLRMLDLTGHTQMSLANIFEQVPYPEKLRVLVLDSMQLQTLPENMMRFTELQQLSLNGNPELDFHSVFEQLEELPITFLNLQYNNLSSLPPTITSMQTLKDLNLSNNTITDSTAYKHLSKLPKLKSLWLTNNQLGQIPNRLGTLKQLVNLYLEYNNLSQISKEMIGMKKLRVLHIGHNDFKELPMQLAEMPSLLLVHANSCAIEKIPAIFDTKGSSIIGLALDQNPIPPAEKKIWKQKLRHFFLLTME